MANRTRKTIALLVGLPVVAFLAIQLLPVWLLQTNPPVVAEPKWDSPQTRALAQRACFDCHSNETKWPWFTRVAPSSWLVTFDIVRGRNHLNFSEWGVARAGGEGGEGGGRQGGRMGEAILNGQMPPSIYLTMHPEAKLTDAEKQQLIDGLSASLK
jgi:hypothetical protein